ncbi:MAG: hypothetical protein DCC67_15100 [Planctomycetota bacterium]|nr:MAG: hypothetical protein DCC67_15100 [Planctomycetota bacterium]
MDASQAAAKPPRPLDPFRRAILRGLGVLLPPLLTIVIILWVWNTVAEYLLVPLERAAEGVLTDYYDDNILPATTRHTPPVDGVALVDGRPYRQTADGRFMPAEHYDAVAQYRGAANVPASAEEVYRLYVDRTFLQRHIVVPVFLSIFLLVLYLLGKFLAAGIGRFFWAGFERGITRLPVVRNVYSSVKQVTDFMFSEREMAYTRVVAIEYPRKGIWQIAFVTGESLLDVACAANEPVLAVFLPCSPMPFTGFTAIVKRSETIDLNITMEQALQYIVSCGVVVPPDQLHHAQMPRQQPAIPELPPTALGS